MKDKLQELRELVESKEDIIYAPLMEVLWRVRHSSGGPCCVARSWEGMPRGALAGALYESTLSIPEFVGLTKAFGRVDTDLFAVEEAIRVLKIDAQQYKLPNGGYTCHYERRRNGFYNDKQDDYFLVWYSDFPGDTSGERRLTAEEVEKLGDYLG